MSAADGERRTISRSAGSAVAPARASNVNGRRDRDTDNFQDVAGSRCLLVQISDRLSFGTQRANILPCNDLTGQAVNFVTLRRRPTAKILHAFQQAQPENLSILAYPHEMYRVLARCNRIAGHKFKILAVPLLEFGRAANDAIDNDLAFPEKGSILRCRCSLRQQRLATRIGRDDMSGCPTT